jgi:Bacterial Ig domain/Glycine rich protein
LRRPLVLGVAAAVLCALSCAPADAHVLFSSTSPGAAPWTVPIGTTSVVVSLFGASGGDDGEHSQGPPGNGGLVRFGLAVTPGTTYQFNVGGQGGTPPSATETSGGAGGVNGGAPGGNDQAQLSESPGGGGGATDVRTGAFALANRFAVAGGGGGSGSTDNAFSGPAGGGDGGGLTGADGGGIVSLNGVHYPGGGGGTQAAGGAGGNRTGAAGGSGALGLGGAGGNTFQGGPGGLNGGGGGGGGGGYYGGGGGSGGVDPDISVYLGGAGGGGGSSLVPPGGTTMPGVRVGDGGAFVSVPAAAPSGFDTVPGSPSPDADPAVTGTADPGENVNLYLASDCSGPIVGTGTSAEFGSLGVTATLPGDGTYTIFARSIDAGGVMSPCSTDSVTYTVDSTPPDPPSVSTSPASPSNNDTPFVFGTAEAGSTVTVYETADCSDAPAASGSADDYALGLSIAVPDNTTTHIGVTATDAAGNVSDCAAADFTEDSIAPPAPSGLGTDPASPANENAPSLFGTAQAGSTVSVYATGDCSGAAVATDTAAQLQTSAISLAVLDDTTNTFTVTATDAAGNVSDCSAPITYVEDSTPPDPPTLVTQPSSPANNNHPTITGTAEDGSIVVVFASRDCTGPAIAFTSASSLAATGVQATVADDSDNEFSALAIDGAGNTSNCSTPVEYVEDSTPPDAPTGVTSSPNSPANQNDPGIRGTAEDGSTVQVYETSDCSGPVVSFAGADVFGTVGIAIAVADDSTTVFSVNATDAAGNVSDCSAPITYVEDSTPPAPPSGLATSPGSPGASTTPAVTGVVEDGSMVNIYSSSDCTGPVTASGTAADFTSTGIVETVDHDASTTLSANATDAAGNTSDCSDPLTYVEDQTPPAPATNVTITPAGPANNNHPRMFGTAEAGSEVTVYATTDCSGAPNVSTSSDNFGFSGNGAVLTVDDDSTTAFSVTVSDQAGNVSTCAGPFTYVEDSTPPDPPSGLSSAPTSPANDNSPTITGTAEDGSTVTIYPTAGCTGPASATGTAADFATTGIGVTVADDTTTAFHATATDVAGNVSVCSADSVTYVEDSTPPAKPSDLAFTPASPANDNTPTLTGTEDAGAVSVSVYASSDCSLPTAVIVDSTTRLATGLQLSVTEDSSTTFSVTATDQAGNVSACSDPITYVEDSTPPTKPTGLSTTPASPSTDQEPGLHGTAEAGATVSVYLSSDCSGSVATTGTAGLSGAFAIPVTVPANATTSLSVTATDAAGNVSDCSASVDYTHDSVAPDPPSAVSIAPTSPANNNAPVISGTAEAASTVKVYTASSCTGTPVATDTAANFASPGITLSVADDSTTAFYVTATDAAGNHSTCSGPTTYIEDSSSPKPTGVTLTPAGPANNTRPKITGTVEAGATVSVYATTDCSSPLVASGTAASFASPGLVLAVTDDSTTTFSVQATDAVGNVSPCSSAVTYVEDSTPPVKPTGLVTSPASPTNSTAPNVIGSAESGSTVRIYTTSDCSGIAAGTGSAAVFASPGIRVGVAANATTTFHATATDQAGNASACSTSSATYANDTIAPAAPDTLAVTPAGPANNNAPVLTGHAEAGSTVRVYTSPSCTGTPVIAGAATALTSPGLTLTVADDTTTVFYATATDAAGNVSPCSAGVTYVEDSSSPTPSALASTPASPSVGNTTPAISGTAEVGSTVRVYTAAACAGSPAATATAAQFATGVTVSVPADATTQISVQATDAVGNVSPCSDALTYVESTTQSPPLNNKPPPPTTKKPTLTISLTSSTLTSTGRVRLTLRCSTGSSPTTCSGKLHVRSSSSASKRNTFATTSHSYRVKAGRHSSLSVALPGSAVRQAGGRHGLKIVVVYGSTSSTAKTKSFTVSA